MRFPNERVQPIINNALQTMTITQLTEQTGVGHHSIAAIRDGTQEWVSEHVMDRLMSGLNLPELMHTDFADIYEADEAEDEGRIAELEREVEKQKALADKWRDRAWDLKRSRDLWRQKNEMLKVAADKARKEVLLANRRAA